VTDAGRARTEAGLAPGRIVELPGRGSLFVRDLDGPSPAAPTLVLVHGWTATADLNWLFSYRPLTEHFRVVALDLRGHGRGIRSRSRFTLEDCADDVAALCHELGIGRATIVGYSMGGPVAQLVWRRHRDLVGGLVLCATARSFAAGRAHESRSRLLAALATAARVVPARVRWAVVRSVMTRRSGRSYEEWALGQLESHDWVAMLEAGRAIGWFSSREWIGELDVPTAVLVTSRDAIVPTRRQHRLAASIPDALVLEVEGDHDVCVTGPERFVPALVAGCRWATGLDR